MQPLAIPRLRQLDDPLTAHQLRHDTHHLLCLLHALLDVAGCLGLLRLRLGHSGAVSGPSASRDDGTEQSALAAAALPAPAFIASSCCCAAAPDFATYA